ncbi:hypothetical protein Y11_31331 [Yersinia enterocolitica subsp. palearctica Y11]|uniref:Uncharacterized protein n=1 Tax=Yersinia enterocolitica subsp. palearctica serotype O:3 (strain DSM 13030 / CIP 106945 / Y11) TaxID=930944 RepID=A0A0H3NWH2_YERE1|nr:hypothetical protein Y11_31331 [Yersinia enterocolitica subsp. palearctica Y11]CCO68102.1 hypothetical protein D322_1222 [Yersinia enterocolitica IP 10393]
MGIAASLSHPVINSFPSGDVIDPGEQNFISQHDRLLLSSRLARHI